MTGFVFSLTFCQHNYCKLKRGGTLTVNTIQFHHLCVHLYASYLFLGILTILKVVLLL